MTRRILLAVIAAVICLSGIAVAYDKTGTVSRVVDGDTFVLESGEKVRLIGIDAPESQDPNKPVEYWSSESALLLEYLVLNKPVGLDFDSDRSDKYGRLLCYVTVNDTLAVNRAMIQTGYAMAYLKYKHSREDEYLASELVARRAGRGMWASPRAVQSEIPVVEKPKPKDTEKEVIVYVTKTGSKYHRGNCSYLKKSKIPMSKADAIASGYGPCSRCRP